jgi:hypothetical protein
VLGKRESSLPNVTTDPGQGGGAGTPSAEPTPVPAITPTPTPTRVLPEGELSQLLADAFEASEATQEELDRLRALLEAIQRELEQQNQ